MGISLNLQTIQIKKNEKNKKKNSETNIQKSKEKVNNEELIKKDNDNKIINDGKTLFKNYINFKNKFKFFI